MMTFASSGFSIVTTSSPTAMLAIAATTSLGALVGTTTWHTRPPGRQPLTHAAIPSGRDHATDPLPRGHHYRASGFFLALAAGALRYRLARPHGVRGPGQRPP